jgi:hypothetical protein
MPKAERVGQPAHFGLKPEFLFEKLLAVIYLSYQALAARKINVGLRPHAAERLEPTLGGLLFYLLIQRGVTLFYKEIFNRLACAENVGRVLFEVVNLPRKVRPAFLTVSSMFHSHARSRWACPRAVTVTELSFASANASLRTARAGGGVFAV